MNYLISYNRSGNTWLRYIIEYLTHQPTWGHEKFAISQRFDNSPIVLISDEPILIKRHEIIPNEITKDDKVIFLLRDYHECIWNSMGCKWEKFEPEFIKYLNLIKFYGDFQGEKFSVKYEQLMDKPKVWIVAILTFLGFDPFDLVFNEMDSFMKDYEKHKENCFSIYDNSINTKDGQKPHFTDEELKFMSRIHEKHCWEKYN
jgi:hypothetical protein